MKPALYSPNFSVGARIGTAPDPFDVGYGPKEKTGLDCSKPAILFLHHKKDVATDVTLINYYLN